MEHDHDNTDKRRDFLDTVFDHTMGGFGIVYVSALLIIISIILIFG